jgi:hypothetical protein
MERSVLSFIKSAKRSFVAALIFVLSPLFLTGSLHFTDVTQKYKVGGASYFGSHGICWVDINSDGLLDIYIKNHKNRGELSVENLLFMNYGSTFANEAFARGVDDAYPFGTHGAVFADFDKDKDFDLFSTTTYGGTSPSFNHIYENDGTGYFQDVTENIFPSQDRDTFSRGVAAADFDGDGDIDFYFTNPLSGIDSFNPQPSPPQQLKNFYINNGDGTFTWDYRGIEWNGFVQGVSAVDVDQDGDIDLAEAKWAPPSTIYLNDGNGYFDKAGASLGLPLSVNVRDNGMTFADFDNDGDLDLSIIGNNRIALYKNREGIFHRYSTMSTSGMKYGYHCCFGDFDHDGDLDLYESGGYFYQNDGQGNFSFVSINISALVASLDTDDPRSSALGDFDNDGDLDIYITDRIRHNVLLRNDVDDSNWIQIEIISDQTGGTGGIGAKLRLYEAGHLGEPGFLKGFRELTGEYGYLAQNMPAAHFGVDHSLKYDLMIEFLNGEQRTVSDITPGHKIQTAYILPPLDLRGEEKLNKGLFYYENIIRLAWNANPGNSSITKYKVYKIEPWRKFIYMDEVMANIFEYVVRNTNQSSERVFAVTAVNSQNIEGAPAFVTIE